MSFKPSGRPDSPKFTTTGGDCAQPPNGGGAINYDRLQRSLLASGDLDGAKTVSDIAGKNSTDLIRNYAYAKSQGFPGSILDYGNATKTGVTPTGIRPGGAAAAAKAPPVGSVQNGYRFRGGNPADRNNWEPL